MMLQFFRRQFSRLLNGLTEVGAAVVAPFERALAASVRAFFTAAESAGGALERVLHGLTWPLRLLGSLVRAVGRVLLPEAVRESLANALFGIPARCFATLLRASEALNLDRPLLWVVWLLQPLWRPIAAVLGFGYAWFVTRQWRQMAWGLPAVLLLLPFALLGAYTAWVGKSPVVSRYQLAVKGALDSQDYGLAQLYERKLAQLDVDTQLTEHRTALALANEGKLELAFERMAKLAPEDRPGYPSAHYWILQQLMSGKLVEQGLVSNRDESRRLAKVHLDHLQTLEISSEYLQYLRAVWLVQGGQLQEAAEILEPLVSMMPSAAFESMRIQGALGQTVKARRDARALVTHMTTREQRGVELQPADYQWWLAAEEVLGNFKQMRKILEQWIALEPDNAQAREALAAVCRRQAAQMLRDPLPDENEVVELWHQASELDPDAESLVSLASVLYRDREQQPSYEKVLAALRDSPRTPVSLLVTVGTEAAIAGQYADARQFFARAVERDDSNPVAWNNYGLVLGEGEDAPLEEALVAVNRALALAPQEHRFRETRGQILLKLQRWQEAVEDLEFALNGLPELEAIHRSLAQAYDALGAKELAALHRGQVN